MPDAMTDLQPLRKVHVKFFAHPILRTEQEIEELKAAGLYVRDAAPDEPLPSHVHVVMAATSGLVTQVSPPPPAPPAVVPAGDKPRP